MSLGFKNVDEVYTGIFNVLQQYAPAGTTVTMSDTNRSFKINGVSVWTSIQVTEMRTRSSYRSEPSGQFLIMIGSFGAHRLRFKTSKNDKTIHRDSELADAIFRLVQVQQFRKASENFNANKAIVDEFSKKHNIARYSVSGLEIAPSTNLDKPLTLKVNVSFTGTVEEIEAKLITLRALGIK